MFETNERPADVVKWYTRARKFPQLLGKTPDGTRLLGGPYTITQAVGGGLVFWVGLKTMSLWANYGLLGNTFALVTATAGTVFGLGQIPLGSRNPFNVAIGLFRAMGAPRSGRLGGRPVRVRRPHQVRHRVAVALPEITQAARPQQTAAAPAAVQELGGALVPVGTGGEQSTTTRKPAPALTGVQALLAAGPQAQVRRD